jgi:peptidoglycan hydrolase CwlO-like protein
VIDVVSILATVALAFAGLFNARIRARIAGKEPPAAPPSEPSPSIQSINQASMSQQSIVAHLTNQNDKIDNRCQGLQQELNRAQEMIADLRVEVAQLRATIERLRMGWER